MKLVGAEAVEQLDEVGRCRGSTAINFSCQKP